MLFVQRA